MKYYLIRHGEPDYSYGDKHGFIGLGNDLAPLKKESEKEVYETAENPKLKKSKIIISSPYTRALQTASILSRILNLEILIDSDLREWNPDLSYSYSDYKYAINSAEEYKANKGVRTKECKYNWEDKETLENRMKNVLKKYIKYDEAIIVGHQMAFQSIIGDREIKCAEIVELVFKK